MFLNIDQIKSVSKFKSRKVKGNLLLELVVGFAVLSILLVSIWSILSTSTRVKSENNKTLKEIESLKIILKEIEVNTSYEELISKNKNNEINISDIENINVVKEYINKDIYEDLKLKIEIKNNNELEVIIPVCEKNDVRISKYK